MIQLLCHLVGDYMLQSHVMATRKTVDLRWAVIHAFFYGLPFLALLPSLQAWLVIVGTHALIDRYAVARRWCQWYGVGFPGLWWRGTAEDFQAPPPFLGVWLVIIVDNTIHLAINFASLRWLP